MTMPTRFAMGLILAVVFCGESMPAKAQVLSRTCFFVLGPKAGQAQSFPGAPPGPVGLYATMAPIAEDFRCKTET